MKKASLFVLSFLLLFVTGCQAAGDPLAQLPDTKEVSVQVEGSEETFTANKAQRDGVYAMYYDPQEFIYVPGEMVDGAFTDQFVSAYDLYDDETSLTPTGIQVCYVPDCNASDWFAALEPGSQFAPQQFPDGSMQSWQHEAQPNYKFGDNSLLFLRWDLAPNAEEWAVYCYTSPYQDGTLFFFVTCPSEALEGWGARMDNILRTLVLAEQ